MNRLLTAFATKYDWTIYDTYACKQVGAFYVSISSRPLRWDIFFQTRTFSIEEKQKILDIVAEHKDELCVCDMLFEDNGVLFVAKSKYMGDASVSLIKKLAKILTDIKAETNLCGYCDKEQESVSSFAPTYFGIVRMHPECAKAADMDFGANETKLSLLSIVLRLLPVAAISCFLYFLFYVIAYSTADASNVYYLSLLSLAAGVYFNNRVYGQFVSDKRVSNNHLKIWLPTAVCIVVYVVSIILFMPLCYVLCGYSGTSASALYMWLWLDFPTLMSFGGVFILCGFLIYCTVRFLLGFDITFVKGEKERAIARKQKRDGRYVSDKETDVIKEDESNNESNEGSENAEVEEEADIDDADLALIQEVKEESEKGED